nr:hypothetical protein [uncultured Sphingomonas sp.]
MPKPDPIPSLRQAQWQRFRRIMRWMGVVSVLAAAAAVYFVTRGESELKIHMLIATALGAGFSVMLGAALMSLAFISSGSGHDEEAHRTADETLTNKDEH